MPAAADSEYFPCRKRIFASPLWCVRFSIFSSLKGRDTHSTSSLLTPAITASTISRPDMLVSEYSTGNSTGVLRSGILKSGGNLKLGIVWQRIDGDVRVREESEQA